MTLRSRPWFETPRCARLLTMRIGVGPMTYFHPAWLEHQRQRFTRADAWRLAPPGSPEAKPPGWLDPSATRVRLKEAQEEEARARAAAEQEALEREILALRHDFAKLKLEYEL